MRRVFHEFSINKMEQIHSPVTNVFLPKRSYSCHTIYRRARTYLALSIDALLGYYEYNRQLYHYFFHSLVATSLPITLKTLRPAFGLYEPFIRRFIAIFGFG
jgi:hypothetical protein